MMQHKAGRGCVVSLFSPVASNKAETPCCTTFGNICVVHKTLPHKNLIIWTFSLCTLNNAFQCQAKVSHWLNEWYPILFLLPWALPKRRVCCAPKDTSKVKGFMCVQRNRDTMRRTGTYNVKNSNKGMTSNNVTQRWFLLTVSKRTDRIPPESFTLGDILRI